MTDLEKLGYRILLGLDPPALSYNEFRHALRAAHLHRQLHEIDIHRVMARVTSTRRRGFGG